MFTIKKAFHFSASHQLKQVAETHPCRRLHGHNYEVCIELQSETLDDKGFVKDYLALSDFKAYIDNSLDHRHLNDVLGDDCVTAELIAKHLYEWCHARWPEVVAVSVMETPKTFAEYRPKQPTQ
ncbi:6-pyruvoyl trahydropterin synthase family protein [Ostreibacterium oceani]|uniref:6-carboxy-5,6,7,8-tetrahydropterin synthase n=1 Tax=Ostreibacterium oceani TaxID=2654998 RepID=A0A6N7EV82_9GAMM|nr:6-pyruvoyl tetrahydropterin synthase family protein [Ostreibacterium oceani]MPV85339.1 6-carboxytetrahydropterin synthase QueD [Ostreibacterium oceani]